MRADSDSACARVTTVQTNAASAVQPPLKVKRISVRNEYIACKASPKQTLRVLIQGSGNSRVGYLLPSLHSFFSVHHSDSFVFRGPHVRFSTCGALIVSARPLHLSVGYFISLWADRLVIVTVGQL